MPDHVICDNFWKTCLMYIILIYGPFSPGTFSTINVWNAYIYTSFFFLSFLLSQLVIPPGYEKYNTIRADPALCFLERVGKPDEKAVAAEQRANDYMDGYVHFRVLISPCISINITYSVSDVYL